MRYAVVVLSFVVLAGTAGADCLTECEAQFVSCMGPAGPGENACVSRFVACSGKCYGGHGGGIPSPTVIDFGNVVLGTGASWLHRIGNPHPWHRKSTLYVSWTPPIAGDIGRHSQPALGPFAHVYGQRFELKFGEGQNTLVTFVPHEPGLVTAMAYVWWDSRGHFSWDHPGAILIRGTGVLPPPPPPPPPPPQPTGDCLTDCLNLFDYCRLTLNKSESVCVNEHTTCASKCYEGIGGGLPQPRIVDFGKVMVGSSAPWPYRYTYRGRPFTRAALHLSWTPPVVGALGRISPARLGPYAHMLGQRFELRYGERQNTLVTFTPTQVGTSTIIMYAWFDHESSFSWANPGLIYFQGTGNTTRVRCCDGTFSPTCTYVKPGCCSGHRGVCQ